MANFYFEVKFDHDGQGQSPPKTIGILTKVFYTYGANLVILAWTGVELSRGQASDYRTHGRTDTQTDAGNDNTRRPKLASGKNEGLDADSQHIISGTNESDAYITVTEPSLPKWGYVPPQRQVSHENTLTFTEDFWRSTLAILDVRNKTLSS